MIYTTIYNTPSRGEVYMLIGQGGYTKDELTDYCVKKLYSIAMINKDSKEPRRVKIVLE